MTAVNGEPHLRMQLPLSAKPPSGVTDALRDLHIERARIHNSLGEALAFSQVAQQQPPVDGTLDVDLPMLRTLAKESVQYPQLELAYEGRWRRRSFFPRFIYQASVSALADSYRYYLVWLAREVFFRHSEFHPVDEAMVRAHPDYDSVHEDEIRIDLPGELIGATLRDMFDEPYACLVNRYNDTFEVVLHEADGQLSFDQARTLIAARDVARGGVGSETHQFLEEAKRRLGALLPPFSRELPSLKLDFAWLLETMDLLLVHCTRIDGAMRERWTTTAG